MGFCKPGKYLINVIHWATAVHAVSCSWKIHHVVYNCVFVTTGTMLGGHNLYFWHSRKAEGCLRIAWSMVFQENTKNCNSLNDTVEWPRRRRQTNQTKVEFQTFFSSCPVMKRVNLQVPDKVYHWNCKFYDNGFDKFIELESWKLSPANTSSHG